MSHRYQSEDATYLYLNRSGFLCIGDGYVLADFEDTYSQAISRRLSTFGPYRYDEYVFDEKEVKQVMDTSDAKKLLKHLCQLPFRIPSHNKNGGSRSLLIGSRIATSGEKEQLLKENIESLFKKSMVLKAKTERLRDGFSPPNPLDYYRPETSLVLPFDALEPLEEQEQHASFGAEASSLVLDFVPLVGSAKSVAQVIAGEDIVTGNPVDRRWEAAGILIGLIPFGKLLTKYVKSSKLFKVVKKEPTAIQRANDIAAGKGPGYNFTGIEDGVKYRHNSPPSTKKTFITDKKHVEDAIGSVDVNKNVHEITSEQAKVLAENLGIPEAATKYGGTLSVIDKVDKRMPALPMGGNKQFLGPGKGLPGGGPEVVINPINNTATEKTIRQIHIKVKDLTEAERKAHLREKLNYSTKKMER